MGITNTNKQISRHHIDCDGTFDVTLALSAAPDLQNNPADIVLVLDRSGSMSGKPLEDMKEGVGVFIDLIDQASDGTQNGQIGSGSHIGIVSFSDQASADMPLSTSAADLKSAAGGLSASGSTNHAAAFLKARELFDPASPNEKVIVLFTDGRTTVGSDPSAAAAAARTDGIVIYCIGLSGSGGIDADTLNDWATDPDASHTAITPDSSELKTLFAGLAANISKPGATNIVIDEILNSDFSIVSVTPPAKGTAKMISSASIQWKIDELGVGGSEGASLKFTVRHTAHTSGTKQVNREIRYTDKQHNSVTFPDPSISVDCGIDFPVEEGADPSDFSMDSCQDTIAFDAGDIHLESQGRIARLSVRIRDVCPHKRVALAVMLTEIGSDGNEHSRGMKMFTIPAHHSQTCRDVLVHSIRFLLPEDLNESGSCSDDYSDGSYCSISVGNGTVSGGGNSGRGNSICRVRNLRARFAAHNIDTGYLCSPTEMTFL